MLVQACKFLIVPRVGEGSCICEYEFFTIDNYCYVDAIHFYDCCGASVNV